MNAEQEIIAQIRRGDDAAYAQLIETYQRGLIYYCNTLVHDLDGAEDVAQEAFIKAYQQLDKYNPDYSFSTWLYKIARNIALNQIRKVDALPLSEDYDVPYDDQIPEVMAREERERQVRASLDALPENYRSVIHLHYWEHKSYDEIAIILKVPETTIKTWLYRARQKLKEECHDIIQ